MGSAWRVAKGFFPLDEVLGLLSGSLTPHGYECLVRLASWMPFGRAAELLDDFLGIQVSQGSSNRYTQAAGAAYVQIQEAEVERLEREAPPVEAGAAGMLQMSVDGAMVPLVHGVWAEVKTLVIGEVQPPVLQPSGDQVVRTRNLSYFSRKVTAEEFQRLALGEVHRRGVEAAPQVAAIQDGAEWEQGFTDYHCPRATRILDFPHAAEHINPIGEFLHGEHTPENQAWLETQLHRLKHEGPEQLLLDLQQLQQQHPESQVIMGNLAYLEKRKAQLQYPHFQEQGWPIGSGIAESANKLVVEARLKGSGMHWADQNVDPMLALRNIICSDRWDAAWPQIEARLRQNAQLRKRKLHHSRRVEPPLPSPLVPALPRVDERILESLSARLEQASQPQALKKNPWRNFKFGKALYQRPTPPKN